MLRGTQNQPGAASRRTLRGLPSACVYERDKMKSENTGIVGGTGIPFKSVATHLSSV